MKKMVKYFSAIGEFNFFKRTNLDVKKKQLKTRTFVRSEFKIKPKRLTKEYCSINITTHFCKLFSTTMSILTFPPQPLSEEMSG